MNAEIINDRDLITMKLLYYFIKIKNYNPVIVQGAKNEYFCGLNRVTSFP